MCVAADAFARALAVTIPSPSPQLVYRPRPPSHPLPFPPPALHPPPRVFPRSCSKRVAAGGEKSRLGSLETGFVQTAQQLKAVLILVTTCGAQGGPGRKASHLAVTG